MITVSDGRGAGPSDSMISHQSVIRARLNRLLQGWAEYFSFGSTQQAYQAVRSHVAHRVRRFLCRRHKLPRGTGRFGWEEVYGERGVLDLLHLQRRRQRRPAHACS